MPPQHTGHRLLAALIVSGLLILTGCVQEDEPPVLVDPTGFVTYVHPTSVFTLSMPQDWVVSDLSDSTALNVAFSPPDSPEPLISVYAISATVLAESRPAENPMTGFQNTSEVQTPLDGLASLYQASFYGQTGGLYKEIERAVQVDGSLRIGFVLERAQQTTTHNDFLHMIGPYFVALHTTLPSEQALQRTLERVVNTLTVNASAGWQSSPRQDASGPHDLVEFTSLNHWADRNGGFVIVGQVRNNADTPLEFVRVNALLYDAASRALIEQDDFVSSDLVQPGEYAPFSIVFPDGLPSSIVRYELHASARYADYTVETFYGPENFAVTSQAAFDENGLLVVSGQVRNEGLHTARLVKVIVTIFDDQRRLVGLDTTLVDVQQLAPGDISPFAVRFYELGGSPSNFVVAVQGMVGTE